MRRIACWPAIASALLFGASTPVSKPLLRCLSPYQLAGLLYLGVCLGILVLVSRKGRLLSPWRMDCVNALRLLGAVVFGGFSGL